MARMLEEDINESAWDFRVAGREEEGNGGGAMMRLNCWSHSPLAPLAQQVAY